MRAVVFGSSMTKEHEQEYKDAYEVGKLLALKGYTVVNGGHDGIMEAVSKGAYDAKGKSVGITCKQFTQISKILTNKWLTEVIETEDLFERIKRCLDNTDLVVIFPGSSGTLTEFMLTWDLMSLKMIPKKPLILFGDYWKPVIDHIADKAQISKSFDDIVIVKDLDGFKEVIR